MISERVLCVCVVFVGWFFRYEKYRQFNFYEYVLRSLGHTMNEYISPT